MSAVMSIATIIGLSVFGSIVGTCLVILVAERQNERRERRDKR